MDLDVSKKGLVFVFIRHDNQFGEIRIKAAQLEVLLSNYSTKNFPTSNIISTLDIN